MAEMSEFEQIVAQYYEPLYKFACSLTRVEADACDLTQQTFYIWATKGHQLRDRSKIKSWLFTTLNRAFLASRRKQTRFAYYPLDEVDLEDFPAPFSLSGDVIDSNYIAQTLSRVDEVYRAAVALFYLEDYSYKETAQILEVPEGTVKSRIARGVRQLRRLIGHATLARSLTFAP